MRKRFLCGVLAAVMLIGVVAMSLPVAAASDMKVSDSFVEILKIWEGMATGCYWDNSQYTIGYGTRCKGDHSTGATHTITVEEAEIALREELTRSEASVNSFIDTNGLTMNQGQFDGVVSLIFNCGSNWLKAGDTLRKALLNDVTDNELIFAFSIYSMSGGKRSPGHVKRRLAEANMYLNGTYLDAPPSNYRYVLFDGNGGTVVEYNVQGYDLNQPVAPVSTATYEGYDFAGWYTEADGGTKIDLLDGSLPSGKYLYAHWVPEGTLDPTEPTQPPTNPTDPTEPPTTPTEPTVPSTTPTEPSTTPTVPSTEATTVPPLDPTTTPTEPSTEPSTAPPTTVPPTTVPPTTVPPTTVPPTTVPPTTVPPTTVPPTTVPPTTVPPTTVPPTTVPPTTVPPTTVPPTTVPPTTVPPTTVPPTTVPPTTVPPTTVPPTTVPPTTVPPTMVPPTTVPPTTVPPTTVPPTTVPPTEPTVPPTEPTVPPNTEPTTPPTDPEDGILVTVTGTNVNVRRGPGTGYTVIGSAGKGQKLMITETAEGSGYLWGKYSGGWICLDYTNYDELVQDDNNGESQYHMGTIIASTNLNIRENAGTGYAVVGQYASGGRVMILEQKNVGATMWGRTDKGWISMTYVKLDSQTTEPTVPPTQPTVPPTTQPTVPPTEPTVPPTQPTVPPTQPTVPPTQPTTKPTEPPTEPTVPSQTWTGTVIANDVLYVRSGSSTNYPVVDYLLSGTKVTILERKTVDGTQWGRISSGWISLKYVKLDGEDTTPPEDTKPPAVWTGTVDVSNALHIRSGAGSENAIVGYLLDNTKVVITKRITVDGREWGQVAKGWICLDYVHIDGEMDSSSASLMAVNTSSLRIRKDPAITGEIIGFYGFGEKVEILEKKLVDSTIWGRTSQGWVKFKYLK